MQEQTIPTRLESIAIAQIGVSDTEAQKARRKRFDKAAMAELAESVRTHGVLQPIIVRDLKALRGPRFELVAGERRYLAAKAASLEEIPAVVRDLTDEQVIEVQLIENLQRADVHPMQEAEGYHELVHKHGHPIEEIYTKVGKSRSYVYGRMKLLALSSNGRAAFYEGKISASIALCLARIPVEKLQDEALQGLLKSEWNYRNAAEWIQDKFMLRLAGAPFPVDDADLAGAGPCGTCPKRTGNQPELFGDVKSADICTDPVCFQAKIRAHGSRQLQKAMDAGQPVLTGKDAVKVVGGKHEVQEYTHLSGYLLVGAERWNGNKREKIKAAKGAEITLLQDPVTGEVHRLIRSKDAEKTKRAAAAPKPVNTAHEKEKREEAFRLALFKLVQPLAPIQAPTKREIAAMILQDAEYDHEEVLTELWQPGVAASKLRPLEMLFDRMSDSQLDRAITDLLLVKDLKVVTWGPDKGKKPERLLAIAAAKEIDVKALRRELEPKKQSKKPTSTAAKKRKAA